MFMSECDVSVSKLLGFETFPFFLVVSDSVSKKFGIEKSIGFGIGKIWYRIKVSESVSFRFWVSSHTVKEATDGSAVGLMEKHCNQFATLPCPTFIFKSLLKEDPPPCLDFFKASRRARFPKLLYCIYRR